MAEFINPTFKETKRKLNLVSVAPGRKELELPQDKVVVTLNAKNGTITIGRASVKAMGMGNALIKQSFDVDNKVIAWEVRSELGLEQLKEEGWKKAPVTKEGVGVMSVQRILKFFQLKHTTYKGLEVMKHIDKSAIGRGNTFYYIDLADAELNYKEDNK